MEIASLINERSVLVCCGTGGVGKTTTAAALALAGADAGRRAVVVTIDPARRLADALGVGELQNRPVEIGRPGSGRLAAMMLDTKSTFDELVRRYASSPEQADRILANRFYRNVSSTLSGTQDYMAIEKLFELHESGDWDLVVVDTPPTREALAFLEAPRLLARLLDNPIYRMVTAPGRGVLRAVNTAARSALRQLSKVVGTTVVDDAVEFFQAFEGMEDGFRDRAEHTLSLLGADGTGFVLVAGPRSDTLEEAGFFVNRVTAAGLSVEAIVVNRVLPDVATAPETARDLVGRFAGSPVEPAARALAEMAAARAGEDARIDELAALAPDACLTRVPFLAHDVHDLEALETVAAILGGGSDQ